MDPIRSHYCSWALYQGMLPNVYKNGSKRVNMGGAELQCPVALIIIYRRANYGVHSTVGITSYFVTR
jgi:hypothetical protein